MKTRELQRLWWDWLGTSERLLRSLYEQTAALTLRDAERVERIQADLDTLLVRIEELDAAAAACAKELAEDLGSEPNLRSLVQVLDNAEGQQVQQIANRVSVAARNIQHVLDKNKALIQSELEYVGGTITLIARATAEQQGRFGQTSRAAVLIDQAA